jgi:hypothetical protein
MFCFNLVGIKGICQISNCFWSVNLSFQTGFGTKAKVDDNCRASDPIGEVGKDVCELRIEPRKKPDRVLEKIRVRIGTFPDGIYRDTTDFDLESMTSVHEACNRCENTHLDYRPVENNGKINFF